MKTDHIVIAGVAALALASACAGSGGSSPTHSATGDIASYQQHVDEVESALTAYQEDMLSEAMTALATCQDVHAKYDAGVRPHLMQMGAMSGDMDAFMGERGGGNLADLACSAADLMSELDRHHEAACRLADLPADQAEAVRHIGVMTAYAAHLSDRSDQMMGALGGNGNDWGPMMSGCEDWNGSAMMHGGR